MVRSSRRDLSDVDVAVMVAVVSAASAPLEIRVIRHRSASVTVQLVGEVDLSNAGSVVEILDGLTGVEGQDVCLDMSGVTFCDCAGLSALVRAHRLTVARLGTLIVVGAHGVVDRLLRISGLDETLTFALHCGQQLGAG